MGQFRLRRYKPVWWRSKASISRRAKSYTDDGITSCKSSKRTLSGPDRNASSNFSQRLFRTQPSCETISFQSAVGIEVKRWPSTPATSLCTIFGCACRQRAAAETPQMCGVNVLIVVAFILASLSRVVFLFESLVRDGRPLSFNYLQRLANLKALRCSPRFSISTPSSLGYGLLARFLIKCKCPLA